MTIEELLHAIYTERRKRIQAGPGPGWRPSWCIMHVQREADLADQLSRHRLSVYVDQAGRMQLFGMRVMFMEIGDPWAFSLERVPRGNEAQALPQPQPCQMCGNVPTDATEAREQLAAKVAKLERYRPGWEGGMDGDNDGAYLRRDDVLASIV